MHERELPAHQHNATDAFFQTRFDGIRYFASNDPSLRQTSVALFGDAGEQHWPVAATYSIPPAFLSEVERRFGVRVR